MRVRCQDERMKSKADATAEERSRVHNTTALADELKWWSKKFEHRLKLNMNTKISLKTF